jgi:hypothetical protein
VLETASTMTPLGLTHADIEVTDEETAPIDFTFHWRDPDRWEGRNYSIAIKPEARE